MKHTIKCCKGRLVRNSISNCSSLFGQQIQGWIFERALILKYQLTLTFVQLENQLF